jgi:hypothetical protein
MKIKVDQFCSLATSPTFQTWLYNHDGELYRRFMTRLRESRGCNDNRELMKSILAEIENQGEIVSFLQKHYPTMIEGSVQAFAGDGVFTHYNPSILTYPRRIIFVGPKRELQKKVNDFLLDKIKGDYIIIGNRAYVEYLKKEDIVVSDQIPQHNWQIAKYRQR